MKYSPVNNNQETNMASCDCEIEIKNHKQIKVLLALIGINVFMFLIEISLGILSESTALIADSLDMLADASVYGIGLYAVGRSPLIKINAAHVSGVIQIILGVTVSLDVIRRLILGSNPESNIMMAIGIMALFANLICLLLISKYRHDDVHMRASWIFSKNDVVANVGIIVSGGLVYLLGSRLPDIIIGMIISIIVIHGGLHIIKDARNERLSRP